MSEIAVREEIEQIHDLAAVMRAAVARAEGIASSNRDLIERFDARRWEAATPEAS